MKTLEKVVRVIALGILIILAASGVLAIFLPRTRERYMDKEIQIEQVDKRKRKPIKIKSEGRTILISKSQRWLFHYSLTNAPLNWA